MVRAMGVWFSGFNWTPVGRSGGDNEMLTSVLSDLIDEVALRRLGGAPGLPDDRRVRRVLGLLAAHLGTPMDRSKPQVLRLVPVA